MQVVQLSRELLCLKRQQHLVEKYWGVAVLVKGRGHIGEALGDGLDMEVRVMKPSLITPWFLAPTAG